jgi:hypothetical protein
MKPQLGSHVRGGAAEELTTAVHRHFHALCGGAQERTNARHRVTVVISLPAKHSRRDQDRQTDDLPHATRLTGWLPREAKRTRMEIVMKLHLLATAALIAVATPAFAQGIDSKHSPYPASAYSGYAGNASEVLPEISVTYYRAAPAYRYSGQHAGGPADALAR